MKTVTFYHDIEQDVNVEADVASCRDALKDLLALEAAHAVRTTYNVVGALWRDQPELVDWIRDGLHEVAFHSFTHRLECPPERFEEEIRLCREHSSEPTGYRSPRSRWNQDTLRGLKRHGFAWSAESDSAPAPYFIDESLVRLPIAGDDWPLHKGVLSVDDWIGRFRATLTVRDYVAIGVHDCVLSLRPVERLAAWERCLEIAVAQNARIVTFAEAARTLVDATDGHGDD